MSSGLDEAREGMRRRRGNQVQRCERPDCTRATFVETEDGLSADFRHGSHVHRETYSIEKMIAFLATRGFVVVEAAKIIRAA